MQLHPSTGRSISLPRARPHPKSQALDQLRPRESSTARLRSRSPALPRTLDDRQLSALVAEAFLVTNVTAL
eukprot:3410289-Amphidinium_carterae.1